MGSVFRVFGLEGFESNENRELAHGNKLLEASDAAIDSIWTLVNNQNYYLLKTPPTRISIIIYITLVRKTFSIFEVLN